MPGCASRLSDFGEIFSRNVRMREFTDCGRDRGFLLPPDLRDRIPGDDPAPFVVAALRAPTSAFRVKEGGTGPVRHHPGVTPAVPVRRPADGILSGRHVGRAAHLDIGVRPVAATRHPDHDMIATVRRESFAAVGESVPQVPLSAREPKLLEAGVASADGARPDADAGRRRPVRHDRAGGPVRRPKPVIGGLMARAGASDGSDGEDPQTLSKELRAGRRCAIGGRRGGPATRPGWRHAISAGAAPGTGPSKPPGETPPDRKQDNPGDPDSRLMRNGHAGAAEVASLAGIDVEVPVATGAGGRQWRRDFRPPGTEWLGAMAETRADGEGRALCGLRRQTVRPVFGVIRAAPGFGRFPMRGPDRVAGERDPVACNGRRLHRLGMAP